MSIKIYSVVQALTSRVGRTAVVVFAAILSCRVSTPAHAAEPALDYTVKLETALTHDDGKFMWFHPRAAVIPAVKNAPPMVVMTLNKLILPVSDFYTGLHVMTRQGLDGPWTGPVLPPPLDWYKVENDVTVSVADVTPGWHARTGRLLAIGCQVRYSPQGKQLEDVKRADQTIYAVFDPKTGVWSPWKVLQLPEDQRFNFARNACSQWLVKPDGKLLVPLYIGRNRSEPFGTTVAECEFDGTTLRYRRHGNIMSVAVKRGLYEPSLAAFDGRYFLTLRNDERAYVAAGEDGLNFSSLEPWLFDDGGELGSYNTQQHWLTHVRGLFLVYTRRGAYNDHIYRHRAPLFMSRVDPKSLRVIRVSEKIVIPERGADMGNFGASAISERESWVTASENMLIKGVRERGANGSTFVARIIWSSPNEAGR